MKKYLLFSGLLTLLLLSCSREEEETANDSTQNSTLVSNPGSGETEGVGEGVWN
ncbi:MAG: hypothetical protein J6X21_03890 [Bacteroidaceae bacterium]|nr:hypothetical protein [Bacteroidaceae bacterium]